MIIVECVFVYADTHIGIGQYVQMGTYCGEKITWRCVDIDDNGALMLCDKIICFKPFDAFGEEVSGSHSRGISESGVNGYYRKLRGSNCWEDSNIRCWLNSKKSKGNVAWNCGNPPIEEQVFGGYNDYADEAGFLTNFNDDEINCMKSVLLNEVIDKYEYEDMSNYGNYSHDYESDISNCVLNLEKSYKIKLKDTVFLLDITQVNQVWMNRSVLGDSYYIGKPSVQCIQNSDYQGANISSNDYWNYWLRTPDASIFDTGSKVRFINSMGLVLSDDACLGSIGIRPAFYLDISTAKFDSGDGTLNNPYTINKKSAVMTIINKILKLFGLGQSETGLMTKIIYIFKSLFKMPL